MSSWEGAEGIQPFSRQHTRKFFEGEGRLEQRFEPASRQHLFASEFQARRKRRNEGWADFGEDLRLLANKAFPDLDDAARERLALTSYLSQLENSQTAVGVKQHRPKTIDEEVRLTLELESYQLPAKNAVVAEVAHVEEKGSRDELMAAVQKSQETMLETMKKLSERLERLELVRGRLGEQNMRQQNRQFTCWNCGKPGHRSQECTLRRNTYDKQQGKGRPSTQ